MKLDVILTPAELSGLAGRELSSAAGVVFDVLRATSTIVTALHNGAGAVIPVSEIAEALEIKRQRPEVLTGGERGGVKIRTEGYEFDLGNSPREYPRDKVRGKTIVSTTTNGTRALRACARAKTVLASSILNLTATAKFLRDQDEIIVVCAGTGENAALEDVLAAGALCERLLETTGTARLADSARIALAVYDQAKNDLTGAVSQSENAGRLLAIPELREDVAFCLQRDLYDFVAVMGKGGIRRLQ